MKQYLALVDTLNQAWTQIRKVYPEIPEAVVLVATGGRRATTTFGWFVGETWIEIDPEDKQTMKGEHAIHEITLVAEQLHRGGLAVFTTLLHEGVHGLAKARGIKEVSGKRHNRKFAQLAEDVGMKGPVEADEKIGWSKCTLRPETVSLFKPEIDAIDKALDVCRIVKIDKPKPAVKKAKCECREANLSKKFLDAGAVICGLCMAKFELDKQGENEHS